MKDLKILSDSELVTYVKMGDMAAFQEIFGRYNVLLVVYVNHKIRDKEESKDIVQEVFVKIWQNRQTFELSGSMANYLFSAVRNKAMNYFRDKKVDASYLSSLQQFIDRDKDSADYLIREKDIQKLIEEEIQALPPKMREVFELRRMKYLSNKEIASQLQISEQTVGTHIKRALKILRTRLGIIAYLIYLTT